MRIRSFVMMALAVASIAGPPARADDPAARQILEQAARAWSDLTHATFTARSSADGMLVAFNPTIEAKMRVLKSPETNARWLTRAEGTSKKQKGEPIHFLIFTDGKTTTWVDHAQKKVFRKRTRRANGEAVDAIKFLDIFKHVGDTPYSEEHAAPDASLGSQETIAGVVCDVVKVDLGKGQTKTWFLGAEDHLPRKMVRRIENEMLGGAMVLEIADLDTTTEFDADSLRINVPAGYILQDDTAPGKGPKVRKITPGVRPGNNPDAAHSPGAEAAPAFELKDPTGQSVTLDSLKDHVAVLVFWGSWSASSKAILPGVSALGERFKDKPIQVLALACRERDPQRPVQYLAEQDLSLRLLLDADRVARRFGVRRYPTIVVISKDGRILSRTTNFRDADAAMKTVADVVGKALGE